MAIPNPGTLQLKVHKDSVLRLWITCWEERKIVVLQVAKIPSRVQKKKRKNEELHFTRIGRRIQ